MQRKYCPEYEMGYSKPRHNEQRRVDGNVEVVSFVMFFVYLLAEPIKLRMEKAPMQKMLLKPPQYADEEECRPVSRSKRAYRDGSAWVGVFLHLCMRACT